MTPDAPAEFVRAGVTGRRGWILLDRGRALNALTLGMVRGIQNALTAFAADDRVEFVTIGSTRPGIFCAGGDIRAVREAVLADRSGEIEAFFAEEFALNRCIAEYPKPFIALIDGVCMGGGMGLSVHGRHRVVTDALTMAMPETAIGYFPDVGASYFLNRLPGDVGTYLALTGTRVNAADACRIGLATACTSAEGLANLADRLDRIGSEQIEATIAEVACTSATDCYLPDHRVAIERCFQADDMGGILAALQAEGSAWAAETLRILHAMSPTSLCVTLALLRNAHHLPLAACLDIELRLACSMVHGHDFLEGVRAMLVDKDKQPRWTQREWSKADITAQA